jgi:RimJ/RimL family protein N-acetyltransferase
VPPICYPDPPLEGEAFVLRRFPARDFDAAGAARDDREAERWVNAIPFAGGGAMARCLEAQRRRGTLLHFAIVDPGDRDYLGEIVLFLRIPQAAELEIGEIAYVIAPAARGRGIAPAAVRVLSEWAFSTLGLARLPGIYRTWECRLDPCRRESALPVRRSAPLTESHSR